MQVSAQLVQATMNYLMSQPWRETNGLICHWHKELQEDADGNDRQPDEAGGREPDAQRSEGTASEQHRQPDDQ